MKKAILTCILLASIPLFALSAPLRVVLDDNYPPYVFRTEDGELRGILVEYWQAWEKHTGRKVELAGMDWNIALQHMAEGRADVIDTMFFNKERPRSFSFGKPYVEIEVPVFVDRSLQGISDISTLKGFIIGVKSGDNVITYLKDKGIDNLKEYPSYEAIVNAAAEEEVFVFSIDEPPALYYISRLGARKRFRKAFNLYTGSFHRAVLKGNEKTLAAVESGFHAMPGNTLTAIERKWTGIPLDYPRYIQTSLYILAAGIAAILLLVTWNNLLKIKVRQKTVDMNRVLLELKRSENHYRELFNNLGDVFFSLAGDGTISLVSPSCLNILGFAPETLKGRKMTDIFRRGSDARRIMNILAREGRVNNFRTMIRKENGEALWVSINAHVSESAVAGDKPAVEGLIRDINELYINELAVKRLGKFREVIIDNTGLLICAADAKLKITLWNKAAERVTGYGFDEIRRSQDPWSLIFPRKDVGLSLIKKADSHDGNAAISERVAVRAKDGILRTLDLSVKKVKIPDLDDYYIIMGNDLTELLTLENELIKNQKLESLGLLAGGIAHDFNNILTAVTGNLSLGVLMDDHKKTISYIACMALMMTLLNTWLI